MPKDWAQPPLSDAPGDLGSVLRDARLVEVATDRAVRTVTLRFALAPDAGVAEATFVVEGATHLLTFGYLPPANPLPEGDVAVIGDWARQGLVVADSPLAFGTPLVVQVAGLHVGEAFATMVIEGYGEDADALVWWEVRVSGARVEAS